MGMFDIIIDASEGLVERELQIKCFGKSLTTYRVGDTVVLYERLSDTDQEALAAEIAELAAAADVKLGATLGRDTNSSAEPGATDTTSERTTPMPACGSHPRFGELLHGIPTEHRDYQLAVSNGTFLTVRGGVLISTSDRRDHVLRCVDGLGDTWDGDVRSAIISPADPLDD